MVVKDRYRVHRVDVRMTQDQDKLERFLNGLKGEVVSVIPNISAAVIGARVDFVLVVERMPES